MLPTKQPSQPSKGQRLNHSDDFGFGFDSSSSSSVSAPAPAQAPPPSAAQPRPARQPRHPAQDEFELAFDDIPPQPQPGQRDRDRDNVSRRHQAGERDGHDEETGGLFQTHSDRHDEEDVLGELGRPPSARPSPRPSHTPAAAATAPPHVLGQLVEMGFGVTEAQQALSATYDPKKGAWDIQAAAEQILAIKVPDHDQPPSRPASRSRQQQRPHEAEDILPPRPSASSSSPAQGDAQQQLSKEQLVSQASALGNSMFKMANSYWKAGNKAFKDAMEQRAAAAAQERSNAAAGSSASQDARPKWMRDLPPDVQIEDEPAPSSSRTQDPGKPSQPQPTLFQDSEDDENVLPPHPSERAPSAPMQQQQQKHPSAPKVYQSSARRKVPQRSAAPSPSPQQQRSTAPSPATSRPPSRPRVVYQRPKIPLPPQALASSTQHRSKGNEHFKLGAYADAEASYTLAIEVLPDQHLACILPLNNRANARLKNGNERGSIEDSSTVLRLALCLTSSDIATPQVNATALEADSAELNVPGLNLREAVGKALGRRAQAYETAEKWRPALTDWELLMQAGAPLLQPAGGMRIVSDGLTRCRKALAPKSAPQPASSASTSAPRRKPAPARPSAGPSKDSDALQHVRAAARKAEADDDERMNSKDAVDAKIAAWKGGKENNLRALISSLDMVVWPDLGWKTIGMHELISENKLKINYTKAIAKLHPDKVSGVLFLFLPVIFERQS